MSTKDIAAEGLESPHLRKKPHRFSNLSDLSPREAICDDCGSRVTIGTDGKREYGHRRDCEHKLRRKPSGTGGWADA